MEDLKPSARQKIKPWLIALSALPSFIIAVIILQILIFGTWSLLSGSDFFHYQVTLKENKFYELVGSVTMLLATILVVWVYWVKIQKSNFISIGFNKKYLLKEIIIGLTTGIFLLSAVFVVLLLLNQIEIENIQFDTFSFINYLLIFIMVGIYEELLIRGYFLGTFMNLTNKYIALIITAILFSLMHIMNANFSLIPFINIVLAGILLGVVYIHTRRIWFPMALHIIWNFLQGPVFGSEVSGGSTGETIFQIKTTGSDLLTGGEFGFEASFIMTGLMIGLIIILERYYKKYQINSAS
ncbi:MAG: CPBP family intramembrane metalloprotease [Prolixibacteraceae bacterium]|nr:CPBP family intramembrane metalloprotease [Prolixibacteraceae bacterium]